jgi:hypothetical protein
MQLINTIKGWFIMTENNLLVVCITLVIMSAVGSVSYYHVAQNEFMSRNIENGIVLFNKYSNGNDVAHCDIALAAPAPANPIFKPKINIGSNIILIIFPMAVQYNGVFVSPLPLNIPLDTNNTVVAGTPNALHFI